MSSDYYGALAGEIADEGAAIESAFLAWLDDYTRREAPTFHDQLRDAFTAGYTATFLSGATMTETCRYCQQPIERCPHDCAAGHVLKGWRHIGYPDKPIGAHYCGGRSINPAAEPASTPSCEDRLS